MCSMLFHVISIHSGSHIAGAGNRQRGWEALGAGGHAAGRLVLAVAGHMLRVGGV